MVLGRFLKSRKDEDVKTASEPDLTCASTQGSEQAIESAKIHLNAYPYSRTGLVKSLKNAGFSEAEARYGVEHCGADWKEQSVKAACNYLNSGPYSYSELVKQLKHAGFMDIEAVHGAYNCGADWNEQAARSARRYLSVRSFSFTELVQHLMNVGFSEAEAVYGANNCCERQDMPMSQSTIVDRESEADEIRKFRELLDDGIITPEEFEAKKRQLLGL